MLLMRFLGHKIQPKELRNSRRNVSRFRSPMMMTIPMVRMMINLKVGWRSETSTAMAKHWKQKILMKHLVLQSIKWPDLRRKRNLDSTDSLSTISITHHQGVPPQKRVRKARRDQFNWCNPPSSRVRRRTCVKMPTSSPSGHLVSRTESADGLTLALAPINSPFN